MLKSALFIFSLFLMICLLLPVQLYGSTILCEPSLNLTSCESSSSSISDTKTINNSRPEKTETPLIIPDNLPTAKDLDDETNGGGLGTTTHTGATNDHDNNHNDDSENSIDENPDTDRDNDKDSRNSGDRYCDDEPSSVPFP